MKRTTGSVRFHPYLKLMDSLNKFIFRGGDSTTAWMVPMDNKPIQFTLFTQIQELFDDVNLVGDGATYKQVYDKLSELSVSVLSEYGDARKLKALDFKDLCEMIARIDETILVNGKNDLKADVFKEKLTQMALLPESPIT